MTGQDGKNLGFLRVLDGGHAGEPRTSAALELERAIRARFYAMCTKDGKALGKNARNVAEGITHPARMLMRRFRDAKRARHDAHNYPLCKQTVAELDRYVDRLFGKPGNAITTTGDHPKAA